MRKFYVAFYKKGIYNVVTSTIELNPGEKANKATFHSKIDEMYFNNYEEKFRCAHVLSWSLIEE